MVVTLPSTCQANTVQDFTALPSTWTTQAPHCEVSQPTWVPVRRRFSRRYCTRRVRGSTSPLTGLPFTVIATAAMGNLLKSGSKRPFFDAVGGAGGGWGRNRVDFARFCLQEQVNFWTQAALRVKARSGPDA